MTEDCEACASDAAVALFAVLASTPLIKCTTPLLRMMSVATIWAVD